MLCTTGAKKSENPFFSRETKNLLPKSHIYIQTNTQSTYNKYLSSTTHTLSHFTLSPPSTLSTPAATSPINLRRFLRSSQNHDNNRMNLLDVDFILQLFHRLRPLMRRGNLQHLIVRFADGILLRW